MNWTPDPRERTLTFSWAGITLGSSIGGAVGIIGGTVVWTVVWLLLYYMGTHRGLPEVCRWFLVIPACVVGTIGALMGSYPELWKDGRDRQEGCSGYQMPRS